ncbi:MAG: hypothetical protein ACREYF_07890 [Gammaproteobacteria bacterium]
MRDFLDNLIDRHADVAPQIKPRLPSIFEPGVSRGRLDVVVPDSNAPEIEETVPGPSVRTNKVAPSHVEPMDPPPFAQVTTPTTSATVIQAMQPKAASVVGWHQQIRPPEATVNEGPKPAVPQKEESWRRKNAPVPVVPARKEEAATNSYPIQTATSRELLGRVRHAHQQKPREHTFPNLQATAEEQTSVTDPVNRPVFALSPRERAGVRELNSTSDALTLTLSERERGLNEGFPKSSAATLIAPVMGRVRHAHREKGIEPTSPITDATAEEQTSVTERVNRPVFSLSPRVKGLTQGLLTPSATLIAPVIPSVAGPERSTSQPEPVINVTIGRIEVRATVSPQRQTPKPENRPPVMGLEEYLRRRSGGHDR